MLKAKKREIVCPHADCFFYSCEHTQVDGEWIPITYCSHPNNDLIDHGKSCKFYRLDWAKQMQKAHKINPVEKVKMERQALLKLLQNGIGYLSPDERDAALHLVEQLQQQEERLAKLVEVQNDIEDNTAHDPFVIHERDSTPPPPKEQPMTPKIIESKPEIIQPEPVNNATPMIEQWEEPPEEDLPEDIVRRFIESWNKQDFEKEYDCLAERLRATPLNDYIQSRQFAYADALKRGKNGSMPVQELGHIHSIKVNGDSARIICDKVEKAGRFTKNYQQRYFLQKENGAWRITQVQTREK